MTDELKTLVDEFQLTPPNVTAPGEDAAYVEQGLRVYVVSDYEWWIGTDKESVMADCLKTWGGGMEDYFPEGADDVECVNLDTNQINLNENCLPDGPFATYREHIKTMIAENAPIPGFFAGRDY